jgi:GNAT superfamily N-acetyltransferase
MSESPLPWQVESCEFAEVKGFASRAAKEHVKVDAPAGVEYFCVRNLQPLSRNAAGLITSTHRLDNRLPQNAVLGFAALMVRGSQARFKADWVRPEMRGKGIAKALMAARMERVASGHVPRASAFCTPLSLPIYLANGFKPKSVNPRGITFVEACF